MLSVHPDPRNGFLSASDGHVRPCRRLVGHLSGPEREELIGPAQGIGPEVGIAGDEGGEGNDGQWHQPFAQSPGSRVRSSAQSRPRQVRLDKEQTTETGEGNREQERTQLDQSAEAK